MFKGKNGTDGFNGYDGRPGEKAYMFDFGGERGDAGTNGLK